MAKQSLCLAGMLGPRNLCRKRLINVFRWPAQPLTISPAHTVDNSKQAPLLVSPSLFADPWIGLSPWTESGRA
jgi:hypothetical protein